MEENKLMKIITIGFYVLVVFLFIYGIYYFYTDTYSVYLTEKEVTIDAGSSYQMKLLPKNSDKFDYKNYKFSTKDNSVIEVNDHGEIHSLKQGTTEVSVRFKNGLSKQKLVINVVDVNVTDLELETNFSVNVSDTKKINVKVNNQDNISTTLTYKSEDETIAIVDAYGNITGVKEGKTHITVTSINGTSKTVEITVKAVDIKIEEININEKELNLNVGEKKTLSVSVVPSNASKKKLEWSSSNTSVATVDSNGVVTAKSKGYSIISVKTSDGINSQITVYVNEEENIILNKYNIEMEVGATAKLTANIPVSYSSSDKSVATIDSNGTIKALKAGKATITASTSNKKNTCIVVVTKSATTPTTPTTIEVKSLEVSENNIKLTEGDTKSLTIKVYPTDATNKKVKYSSEDSNIATVNSTGKITAKSAGKTKIIITSESNKSVKSEVLVTVKAKVIEISSISLNTTSKTLVEGDTYSLVVTYVPQDATDKSVTWKSSDSTVASVSSSGKVTAKKNGTATITATTSNNKTATAKITVNKKTVDVTSVKITSNVTSMYVGDSVTLSATVSPDNATNKKVTWSSNDTTVATVDSAGKVTAKKSGSVKITVKSVSNTKVTDSKTITVNVKNIPVTKLTTDTTAKTLKYSKTFEWKVTVEPSNATNKQITYSSSDTTIATVDSNGKITSKSKNGTATITAKSKDNSDKKVTIKITVYEDKPLNIPSSFKFYSDTKYSTLNGYYLYIPKNATENMPLIVMFPPNSSYGENMKANAELSDLSKLKAFIYIPTVQFVYTDASPYKTDWNQTSSISAVSKIKDLIKEYKLNDKKISLTAASSSGYYIYWTANQYRIFSGIVPFSAGLEIEKIKTYNDWTYLKKLPMLGFGEHGGYQTASGRVCSVNDRVSWNADPVMCNVFKGLGKCSDCRKCDSYNYVAEKCHGEMGPYVFGIDKDKNGLSDVFEWMISQTKQ